MGIVLSSFGALRTFLQQVYAMILNFKAVKARVLASPGVPGPDPPPSYWTKSAALPPYVSPLLPGHADVVIIGSGVSGAAIARTLLSFHEEVPLRIVLLDARDPCSGATGRNGGHIKPYLYEEYEILKNKFGLAEAQKVIQFRQAHVHELVKVAQEENVLEETGCQAVSSLDVFSDSSVFESYKVKLAKWVADMPDEAKDFTVIDAEEAQQRFHLSSHCKGVISSRAGILHPYKLVNAIFRRLCKIYPHYFTLCSKTTCTAIASPSRSQPFYSLTTSSGTITAPHVIHASNSYCSYLIPLMRGKIIPARATASAQRAGLSFSQLHPTTASDGARSWMFYHKTGFDYLSQTTSGELIFGGGFVHHDEGLGEVGLTDDDHVEYNIASYLGGALPVLFGDKNWGKESVDSVDDQWNSGRVMAIWSGIEGISADGLPWVGSLPSDITQRVAPAQVTGANNSTAAALTAPPNEWLCSGYSGDGMSSAYLCGKALALMLLQREKEGNLEKWFPNAFRVTKKRWNHAQAEDLLEETGFSL